MDASKGNSLETSCVEVQGKGKSKKKKKVSNDPTKADDDAGRPPDSQKGGAEESAGPATWATKVEFDKLEVTNPKSVDFLSRFDKDYLAQKEVAVGNATSPTRPVVKNKKCLDFLDKFDKSYSAVKAETEKNVGLNVHANNTKLEGARKASLPDTDMLLTRGAMKTYEGKLQAEDRALDAIQRILTSDFELVAEEQVMESRNVEENELERDVDMFAL